MIMGLLLISTVSMSEEMSNDEKFTTFTGQKYEREVIGGDILYTSRGAGPSETAAVFVAQQGAIKSLMIECSIPHKEMKVWKTKTEPVPGKGFYATVQVGIASQFCDEGKKANTPEAIAKLTNPETVKSQETYDLYIQKMIGVKEEAAKPKKKMTIGEYLNRDNPNYKENKPSGRENASFPSNEELNARMKQQDKEHALYIEELNKKNGKLMHDAQERDKKNKAIKAKLPPPDAKTLACRKKFNRLMASAMANSDRYGNMASSPVATEYMNAAHALGCK
jgi:hypothetical protein